MSGDIHPVAFGVVLAVAAFLGLFPAGVLHFGRVAHADPKPGLWQESVTQADGVTIRKIRDTTGGDGTVCYVASRMLNSPSGMYTPGLSVAISCIPASRP